MSFFFFNDTATTEIYTLSLHDALPISDISLRRRPTAVPSPSSRTATRSRSTWTLASCASTSTRPRSTSDSPIGRSEEHTSELQSRQYLVCRLLLEKKQTIQLHLSHPIL